MDLVSPLVTPLTYEGLIDDTVGIENARVKLDAAVLGTSEQQEAMSATMAASATAGKAGVDGAAAAGKPMLVSLMKTTASEYFVLCGCTEQLLQRPL